MSWTRNASADLRALTQPIPEGSLAQSLELLSNSSGLQVLYDPSLIEGRRAPRVEATESPLAALGQLLQGSGLTFEVTGPDGVAIVRAKSAMARPHPAAKPATTPQLPALTILGEREQSGLPSDSAESAMRQRTPLLSTPASVDEIDENRLRELAADRFEQALTYLSDVAVIPSGLSSLAFSFRGFTNLQYYLDGVRVSPDLFQDGFRELSNIESIEVLKGPTSILFGRGAVGGAINVIPKVPLASESESAYLEIGSFNFKRATFEVNEPLPDLHAGFRVNTAYEATDSYREYESTHRTFVAPSFSWQPTPAALVTIRAEYLSAVDPQGLGLPVVGQGPPRVSRGLNLLGPTAVVDTEDRRLAVKSDIILNEHWRWRQKLDFDWLRTPEPAQFEFANSELNPQNCTARSCPIERDVFSVPRESGKTFYWSEDLVANADWFGMAHSLVVGVEFFQATFDADYFAVYSNTFATDLYHPLQVPVTGSLLANPDLRYWEFELQRWAALYAEDRVHLSERWSLMLGAREEMAWQELRDKTVYAFGSFPGTSDDPPTTSLKPRVALMYELAHSASGYLSYTESLGLSNGRILGGFGGTGAALPPETARQWEIGAKWAWAEGPPNVTVAFYDLQKRNIAVPDPISARALAGYLSVIGVARSRGAELESVTPFGHGWELRAAVAYADARIFGGSVLHLDAEGNEVAQASDTGKGLYGTPKWSGSAWMAYRSPSDWTLGAGVIARGARFGDNANDYRLNGYATWAAMASRRWRLKASSLTAQLNIDNVFSTRYAESSLGTYFVMPGPPMTWRLGLRWER